jgi:hypothetical protein
LGEILAETVRLYGARVWPAFGLGALVAAAFVAGIFLHPLGGIAVISLVITGAWAAATRIVAGDTFTEAWAQVAVRAPVLLVLTAVAIVPFALAVSQLVLIVFGVAWLALVGFSIPVAVMERDTGPDQGLLHRLGFALRRALTLARVEYFHAAGVMAALVMIYILLGVLLVGTLRGFAENGDVVAVALAQLVLGPFFFLGLAVHYFEQRARPVSSRRRR